LRKLFFSLAFLAAAPALAQDGGEMPSAAEIERMCSPRGAMQFKFGQTGVPNSSRIEADLDIGFTLPASFAPFTRAQPRSTEWSGRLMEVTYWYPLAKEQAENAEMDMILLAQKLEEAGWKPLEMPPGEEPIYLMGYGTDFTFARDIDGETGKTRMLVALDHSLGRFTMTCGRDDLLRVHAEEAFGKLPPGTPRPTVPDIAIPRIATAADCDTPELKDEVGRIFANGGSSKFMGEMMARTRYRDRLTAWMLWKLESSRKITPEALLKLSLGALGQASPGGNPFAALEMIQELMPLIARIEDAEKTGDPAAMCRSLIPFHAWVTKVDAITLKQTQATQAALVAKASQLGVSLD
jgi:hypothetical protein